MQDNSGVSITFKNTITNMAELEKYADTLQKIKGTMSGLDKGTSKAFSSSNAGIKTLAFHSGKIASNIKSISSNLKKAVSVAALAKLTKTMASFINKSSDYLENFNLFQAAFDGNYKSATKFVNKMAEMYGLDESWLIRTVGTFKQLSNAMNLSAKDGENLAKLMTQMSLDISSLYNLDIDRATSTLQSALAGQTKPIRGATGGDITMPTLQTTLDQLGINRAVSTLSFAEKRLLIIISLTKQLNKSIGDMGRTIESPANQTRILAAQWERLTRTVGSIFMKTIAKILPYLNAALMVLTEIAKFVAKIFGFDLGDYDYFTGTSADIDDLSDSLDGATDSANSLKKALSGLRVFDRLNVITTPSAGSGSGGVGGGAGGISGDILDEFNKAYDEYQKKLDNVKMKATEIRDTIMEWLGFTKEVNKETGEVFFTYDTVGKKAEDIAKEFGTNLGNMLNYYTSKIKWDKLGQTLATGINTALNFINTFVQTYNWKKLGENLATFLNNAIKNADFAEIGKTLTNKIRVAILTLVGFVSTFDFGEFGRKLGQAVNSAIENIPISDLIKGINLLVNGIFDAIKEFVKTVKWGEVVDNIMTILSNLDWKVYAIVLAPAIAKLIGAIFGVKTVSEAIVAGIKGALFTGAATGAGGAAAGAGGAAVKGAIGGGVLSALGTAAVVGASGAVIGYNTAKFYDEAGQLKEYLKTAKDRTKELEEQLDIETSIYNLTTADEVRRKNGLASIKEVTSGWLGIKGVVAQIGGYQDSTLETVKEQALLTEKQLKREIEILNTAGGTKDQQKAVGKSLVDQSAYLGQIIGKMKMAGVNTDDLEKSQRRINAIIKTMPDEMNPLVDKLKLSQFWTDKTKKAADENKGIWKKTYEMFGRDILPDMSHIVEKTKESNTKANEHKSIWDKISEKLGGGISNGIDKIKDKIAKNNALTDKNKQTWQGILDKVKEYVNKPMDKKSKITITSDTTSAESGLSGFISRLKGNIQSAFNGIDLSGLKNKFSKIFSNFKESSIGKALGFASGGLPPVGQLFVANERGPELVGQIGGQSFVANQNQMMDLIDKKIGNAQNATPQVFNIYLDENHKLGTYTLNQLQGMAKTNGKAITII